MNTSSYPDAPLQDILDPLRSTRAALLVVDMQRAFMEENSSMGAAGLSPERMRTAIPGALQLVEAARAASIPRIFTRYVYLQGMVDFGLVRTERAAARKAVGSLALGTEEAELIEELQVRDDEIIIDKARPSSFYGTRLEPVLTTLGIQTLVVCGVTTNICVETTVRDAGQRDYNTFVVSDAVAEYSEERHQHALNSMAWTFAHVVEARDVTHAWETLASR